MSLSEIWLIYLYISNTLFPHGNFSLRDGHGRNVFNFPYSGTLSHHTQSLAYQFSPSLILVLKIAPSQWWFSLTPSTWILPSYTHFTNSSSLHSHYTPKASQTQCFTHSTTTQCTPFAVVPIQAKPLENNFITHFIPSCLTTCTSYTL